MLTSSTNPVLLAMVLPFHQTSCLARRLLIWNSTACEPWAFCDQSSLQNPRLPVLIPKPFYFERRSVRHFVLSDFLPPCQQKARIVTQQKFPPKNPWIQSHPISKMPSLKRRKSKLERRGIEKDQVFLQWRDSAQLEQ